MPEEVWLRAATAAPVAVAENSNGMRSAALTLTFSYGMTLRGVAVNFPLRFAGPSDLNSASTTGILEKKSISRTVPPSGAVRSRMSSRMAGPIRHDFERQRSKPLPSTAMIAASHPSKPISEIRTGSTL